MLGAEVTMIQLKRMITCCFGDLIIVVLKIYLLCIHLRCVIESKSVCFVFK